ncbi:hypothetical protein AB0E62_34300 [Streptomyces sp. NPDC038707]|uniref:hypothetical protein n=1 Tax=Streptomyces sp. NPDC038707 TaxID=3154329 RepID=UPI003401FACA
MIYDVAPETVPCAVCDRAARERVHRGCRDRMADDLRDLPQLYRQLAVALLPGRRGDGPAVSSTPGSSMPSNEDALDLRSRGGIEGVVGGWARDLCDRENWDVPAYQSVQAIVDWACTVLLTNLGVICDEHPAVKEIAQELGKVTAQARGLVTGEKQPRKIGVCCPCGRTLKITIDTAGVRCPSCSAQYGHSEALRLPLAERRAA